MVARWVTGKIPCGSPSLNWESPQTERSHGTARNLARQGKSSDPRWRRGRQLLPDRSACGRDDRLGGGLGPPRHRGRVGLAGERGDRDGGLLQRLLLESDSLEDSAA